MTEIGKKIYKELDLIIKSVDAKTGRIEVFVNVYTVNGQPVEDSDGDISSPTSFNDSIAGYAEKGVHDDIYWYVNHNNNEIPGIPIEFKNDSGINLRGEAITGLVAVGQINMEKQFGRDTLSDYVLYQKEGRSLKHSIGVIAIERDPTNRKIVTKWKLIEFSTLTKQAANAFAEVKSKKDLKPELIAKEHGGSTVVECPSCKFQFIYETAKIYKLEEQILSDARMYLRWMAEDMVYQEVHKLEPEIAMLVSQILGNETISEKLKDSEITQKELSEKLTEYARCHKCYGVVVKSDTIKEKEKSKSVDLDNIEIKINLNLKN